MLRLKRRLLFVCGWTALGLGIVGLAVPVLPTVPFVLLAAWCFLRSSERWHQWLVSHPVFGRHIADYLAGRGLRAPTKVVALATLWASVLLSVVVFVPLLMIDVLLLAIAAAVSVYLLRLPTWAPGGSPTETNVPGDSVERRSSAREEAGMPTAGATLQAPPSAASEGGDEPGPQPAREKRGAPVPKGDRHIEYLAYGSNMLSARLRSRVRSATNPRVVALPGRAVSYRKLSWKDGSAKCDLAVAPDPSATAYGVVFDIDPSDRGALDAAEGCGHGYHAVTLEVTYSGRVLHPFAYVADQEALVSDLPPFDWYRDLVVAGAKEHALPPDYVASLAAVTAAVDPEPHRAAEERSIIPAE